MKSEALGEPKGFYFKEAAFVAIPGLFFLLILAFMRYFLCPALSASFVETPRALAFAVMLGIAEIFFTISIVHRFLYKLVFGESAEKEFKINEERAYRSDYCSGDFLLSSILGLIIFVMLTFCTRMVGQHFVQASPTLAQSAMHYCAPSDTTEACNSLRLAATDGKLTICELNMFTSATNAAKAELDGNARQDEEAALVDRIKRFSGSN